MTQVLAIFLTTGFNWKSSIHHPPNLKVGIYESHFMAMDAPSYIPTFRFGGWWIELFQFQSVIKKRVGRDVTFGSIWPNYHPPLSWCWNMWQEGSESSECLLYRTSWSPTLTFETGSRASVSPHLLHGLGLPMHLVVSLRSGQRMHWGGDAGKAPNFLGNGQPWDF